MAQRGGTVIAQVRYGKKVYSPLVTEGSARVLCSFEAAEALRAAHYLAPDGLAVVNQYQIIPVSVSSGMATSVVSSTAVGSSTTSTADESIHTSIPSGAKEIVS